MKLWAYLRDVFIDRVVAVSSYIVYGTRYQSYLEYLDCRKRGNGFRCRAAGNARAVRGVIAVAVTWAVLRLLVLLPTRQGELIFIRIMKLKQRCRNLP